MAEFNDREKRIPVVGEGRIDNSSSLCVSSESQRHSSIAVTKLGQPASRTNISFSLRVFSTDFAKDLPFGRDVRAGVTKQPWSRVDWRGIAALGSPEP